MPEHTIAENLTRLQNAKTAIGNAITAKGGTVAAGDGLEEFPADIATITNQYTAGDEGKVVSSGALISQTAYPTTITENGTYNTTENNSVTVDVPSLPIGTDMCKLTPVSGNITTNEMYAVNIGGATIVFGFFNVTISSYGPNKIFSYPSSFNFAHTRKCKYWHNAESGDYLSSNYDYSVNTSTHQVSLYRAAGGLNYPVVYCFT